MNVSAAGDEPDNLVIRWSAMEKEDWNGEELRYLVRYRLDESGAEWKEFAVEDPKAESTTIRDQPTFRKYLVQVRALNVNGPSIVNPETIIGYSGEDLPREAPTDFIVTEIINATTVAFAWTHVDPDSVRGHFRGYRVTVKSRGGSEGLEQRGGEEEAQRRWVVEVGPEQRFAVLPGLHPMHRYSAVVQVLNSRYQGPASAVHAFQTPQGLPSQVEELVVEAVGAHTILVSWSPPRLILGRLEGYFLTFTGVEKGGVEETFVRAYNLHYVWWQGEPDQSYSVAVWGQTGGGEGPKSVKLTRTWPKMAPGRPEARVESVSGSVARVEWVPSETSLPGSGFYVNYTLEDEMEWRKTELVKVPGRTKTLRGLVSNAAYLLKVVSNDGPSSLETASETLRFHTKHLKGLQNRIAPDTFTSAAWFIAAICSIIVAVVFCVIVCMIQRNKGGKYPGESSPFSSSHLTITSLALSV